MVMHLKKLKRTSSEPFKTSNRHLLWKQNEDELNFLNQQLQVDRIQEEQNQCSQ